MRSQNISPVAGLLRFTPYSRLLTVSMPLGHFTLEDIVCTAIGADDCAGMGDVEENPRMACPERRVGQRAVQRQVMRGDFDGLRYCIFDHDTEPCDLKLNGRQALGSGLDDANLKVRLAS